MNRGHQAVTGKCPLQLVDLSAKTMRQIMLWHHVHHVLISYSRKKRGEPAGMLHFKKREIWGVLGGFVLLRLNIFTMCGVAVWFFSWFAADMSAAFSFSCCRGPELRIPVLLTRPALLDASLQHFSAVCWGKVEKRALNVTLQRAFIRGSRNSALLNSLPLYPTLYLTLTICWVSAKNPIRLIWNSPGERTLSFWRTDN